MICLFHTRGHTLLHTSLSNIFFLLRCIGSISPFAARCGLHHGAPSRFPFDDAFPPLLRIFPFVCRSTWFPSPLVPLTTPPCGNDLTSAPVLSPAAPKSEVFRIRHVSFISLFSSRFCSSFHRNRGTAINARPSLLLVSRS